MCSPQDPLLMTETLEHIKTKSRDQDILQYFRGVSNNIKMRKALIKFFKVDYETVRTWYGWSCNYADGCRPQIMKRFGDSFSLPYLFSVGVHLLHFSCASNVPFQFSFNVLSSEKDLRETYAFFAVR
jgi:aminopeptidase 2